MIKKVKKIFFWLIIFLIVFVFFSNYLIIKASKNKIYSSVDDIPKNKVGLVLGTSKYLKNGNLNYYFVYRIKATIKLYKNGKIDYVLISGDNGNINYDEPTDFKNELIKNGIPEDKIYLDYAGFRTLDSVVRAKEIFGQKSITFISQEFHNQRAIFLAKHFDIDAIGYSAKNVSGVYGLRVKLREYLAKTKAVLDIILGVQPKFLGKKIHIG